MITHNGNERCGHSHASLQFSINVYQGKDLAACDTNIFGKESSSDPYVIASILPGGSSAPIQIGQTRHVVSTLRPKWNEKLSKLIPPGSFPSDDFIVELKVMDYDLIGEDDCMGIVHIPMKVETGAKATQWYQIPADSAEKASGSIQAALEAEIVYSIDSFLPKRSSHANPHPQEFGQETKKKKRTTTY